MPKYVHITDHLGPDDLLHCYRKAIDPLERSHFQIIWLLAQGKRVYAVAEMTGYCANWIRILARRYNQEGPQALADQRHYNRGAPPILSKEQQEQLPQVRLAHNILYVVGKSKLANHTPIPCKLL